MNIQLPPGGILIGLGTDIIEVERVRGVLERQGERFLHRVFTDEERAYCSGMKYPHKHYAARFAAKEAVGKALGSGVLFTWREIEIRGRPKPGVALTGRTQKWAEKVGAGQIDLSMTHSRELAAAVCLVSLDA